jgi:hypothetical protein
VAQLQVFLFLFLIRSILMNGGLSADSPGQVFGRLTTNNLPGYGFVKTLPLIGQIVTPRIYC